MLRNYLITALRHLVRNRLYSGVSIVALTTGICAALLSGLVIRNQTSYEQFIRGYSRTYLVSAVLLPSGRAALHDRRTPSWLAETLKLDFRDIQAIARTANQKVRLRHGQIESGEIISWADASVFEVLPFPTIAGDLQSALQRPDSIVLTRSVARKYFGRDDPIGQSIIVNGAEPMTVTAIIEDLPINGTLLETGIFASGRSSGSLLSQWDSEKRRAFALRGLTYLRLAPRGSIDRVRAGISGFIKSNYPQLPAGLAASLNFVRIDKVHLSPLLSPGTLGRLTTTAIIGLLTLAISCVVFVNLSTARAARRALDVSVRKAVGASRGALIVQFLGEALVFVLLATVLAAAVAHWLVPHVNAFLNSGATPDYWRDPGLMGWLCVGVLATALIAGAYPAVLLSAFRPATILRGLSAWNGGAAAREVLVSLQFTILIGLLIATMIVYQQHQYAMREAMRLDVDEILVVRSPCSSAFETEVRALPGVQSAFCSTEALLNGASFGNFRLKDGSLAPMDTVGVQFGALELYGVAPLAGSWTTQEPGSDGSGSVGRYVINESAAHRLGFGSAAAAVGQPLSLADRGLGLIAPNAPNEILAVVPDFAIDSVGQTPRPTIYYTPSSSYGLGLRNYQLLNIKLTGRSIPETLAALDRLWTQTGGAGPIDRFFVNDYIQDLYLWIERESQGVAIFAGVAVLLACLGLVGLGAYATERRTREIGIRKAMGAGSADILRMLLWQFAKPAILANAIAWPLAAYLMHRWLQGFADHVDLSPLIFVCASAFALAIALSTVLGHALRVARAKPVGALRYE